MVLITYITFKLFSCYLSYCYDINIKLICYQHVFVLIYSGLL